MSIAHVRSFALAAALTASFSIADQGFTGTMGSDNVSLAAVPEPSTLAALLLGGGALAGMAWRRRVQG